MERDDIAVISEGLHASLSGEQEKSDFLKYFESAFRNTDAPYHKFRRFDREETKEGILYREVDGHVQMTIPAYLSYLELHKKRPTFEGDCGVSFLNSFNKMCSVDARAVVLYMVDAEMPRYFYKLHQQYKTSFKVPEVLIGSDCCLLGCVSMVATCKLLSHRVLMSHRCPSNRDLLWVLICTLRLVEDLPASTKTDLGLSTQDIRAWQGTTRLLCW